MGLVEVRVLPLMADGFLPTFIRVDTQVGATGVESILAQQAVASVTEPD